MRPAKKEPPAGDNSEGPRVEDRRDKTGSSASPAETQAPQGFTAIPPMAWLTAQGMPATLVPAYLALLDFDRGRGCTASRATIARAAGKSVPQIKRDLQQLRLTHWINVELRTACGTPACGRRKARPGGSLSNLITCRVRWDRENRCTLDTRTGGVMNEPPQGGSWNHGEGFTSEPPGGFVDEPPIRSSTSRDLGSARAPLASPLEPTAFFSSPVVLPPGSGDPTTPAEICGDSTRARRREGQRKKTDTGQGSACGAAPGPAASASPGAAPAPDLASAPAQQLVQRPPPARADQLLQPGHAEDAAQLSNLDSCPTAQRGAADQPRQPRQRSQEGAAARRPGAARQQLVQTHQEAPGAAPALAGASPASASQDARQAHQERPGPPGAGGAPRTAQEPSGARLVSDREIAREMRCTVQRWLEMAAGSPELQACAVVVREGGRRVRRWDLDRVERYWQAAFEAAAADAAAAREARA